MPSPSVKRLHQYENTFRRAFESAWARLIELQSIRMREEAATASARARAAQAAPTTAFHENEPKSPDALTAPPAENTGTHPKLAVADAANGGNPVHHRC